MRFAHNMICSLLLWSLGGQGATWPFDITSLRASDGSITAKFVSLGATLTELWVNDKMGKPLDVVLGYDDNSRLLSDPDHPVFNAIIGRYANRIKNGTFSIPITKDDQPDGPGVYRTPKNNLGAVTLHGGVYGWDRRGWTLVSRNATSVTYAHLDNADEGFPGLVTVYVTHTVKNGGILQTSVHATATEEAPIMITQHIYWNLEAFQDNSTTIMDHFLYVDGSKVITYDSHGIPTGNFIDVAGTPFDFRTPRPIGWDWNQTIGLICGPCQGYDHSWVFNQKETHKPSVSLFSIKSGIRVDIISDQPASQVFTAFGLNTPRKEVHGGPAVNYTSFSAVALEQEGYIDAINNPEWGVDQIYGPGKEFSWNTQYRLSVH